MKTVSKNKVVYTFSPNHKTAIKVKPEEEVLLKTEDALGGQIRSEKDSVKSLDLMGQRGRFILKAQGLEIRLRLRFWT
jgi:acetamidase/formamidase